MTTLQFAPFKSFVDAAFFKDLSSRKLNEVQLGEPQLPIIGTYYVPNQEDRGPELTVDGTAFGQNVVSVNATPVVYSVPGHITNFNTLDAFRDLNKTTFMRKQGIAVRDAMLNGDAISDPSRLSQFFIIAYADIKKYQFYYWFAFPAVSVDSEVVQIFTEKSNIAKSIESWRANNSPNQWGFFLIEEKDSGTNILSLKDHEKWKKNRSDTLKAGFVDPSTIANVPGWPLRNFISLLSSLGIEQVSILCYRDHAHFDTHRSFWLDIRIKQNLHHIPVCDLKISGWERNSAGKLVPKFSDIGTLMNPIQLADQAVDLNLKLMKWRVAPDLDLDIIRSNKCLLLGSGTLGSYISRGLLGWGVRQITFVDNGKVSFSNPVRQPLYNFNDCLDGGAPKAQRAAETLKEIYPSVISQGYDIEIPMAGHPVSNEARQLKDYNKLVELIDSHDTIFLAMDSRESRWLPTVICSAKHKLVINVALGFDTYVVMRHGVHDPSSEVNHRPHLGCYFCNDVVAPVDSLSGQTLDQMCTVTRPGVAMLASAIACEMFSSLLQTREKELCPAATDNDEQSSPHPVLSVVPHQIRGFLQNFTNLKIWGPSYPYCSACSEPIVEAWRSGSWEFVKRALNDSSFVNEISGLAEIQSKTEALVMDSDWDVSEAGE